MLAVASALLVVQGLAGAATTAEVYWAGTDLGSKSAIQSRLKRDSRTVKYGELHRAYKKMWRRLPGVCKNSKKIYDVYSLKCWRPEDNCGRFQEEGDCFKRAQAWPNSWWNRKKNALYSDVFHVMPADGYVSARRGNLPFGEVETPTYTSKEGHKVGPCVAGFSDTCFEPTDRTKGLLARGLLYVAVRYANNLQCCDVDAVNGADLKRWTKNLTLTWHADFPPQPWEIEFNERAFQVQGNRNPFIDHPDPEFAQQIFKENVLLL